MAQREQRVEISLSMKTHIRVVYDIRNNEALKFQTGYVEFDNDLIPVWRPMDPDDKSLHASWREGKWNNIYRLHMPRMKDVQHRKYELVDIECDGQRLALPKVSVVFMGAFTTYLQTQKG